MKRILFLSGTRADFGKLKSLITIVNKNNTEFTADIFVTGMHLHRRYGYTVNEIEKSGFPNIYKYINFTSEASMDLTLAKTIEGLSYYIQENRPDLIVVHGDRVEAMAGAIVGILQNIKVAHIEGGEVSGTVDEIIRHAVSKMSHIHFVSNESAKKRLVQLGEHPENIFVIGSPDVDAMLSSDLPSIEEVKRRYEIDFDEYGILLFHPVTTESEKMHIYAKELVDAVIESGRKYAVIYPNNDLGSNAILHEYNRLKDHPNFKIFPSIRFEYFLVLLKYSKFMIGNSSAGIREAPYYGLPVINIGTRQNNRAMHADMINCECNKIDLLTALSNIDKMKVTPVNLFGNGDSDQLFFKTLKEPSFWEVSTQKIFNDII